MFNVYRVTCHDGPHGFPSTVSWIKFYALADYALFMRRLGWRKIVATIEVEDRASDN